MTINDKTIVIKYIVVQLGSPQLRDACHYSSKPHVAQSLHNVCKVGIFKMKGMCKGGKGNMFIQWTLDCDQRC